VVVLIALTAVLAPASVVAAWAHDQVSDTERYVATVQPLASDPAVQDAMVTAIVDQIFTYVDVKAVTTQAVDALAQQGLPPRIATGLTALTGPLADSIRGFVTTQVRKVIQSPAFADAWVQANRVAHTQLVAVLSGEGSAALNVQTGKVSVNVAAVINSVKTLLEQKGFTLASSIPTVNASFTIMESADLVKAQNLYRALERAAMWLPLLGLLCLGAAVALARNRRRTLFAGALTIAVSMLVLGIALNVARALYLQALPSGGVLTPAAAASIYDAVVQFIRISLRAVLLLALVVAAIAWLVGPGPAPTAVRRTTTRTVARLRDLRGAEGRQPGTVETFVYTYKSALRGGVLALGVLVYVLASHPTALWTLVLVAVLGVALLVIEFLARPPVPA
jgi:hypothetical protein